MKPKILLNSNMIWTISQFRLGLIMAFVNAGYEVVCAADTDTFSDLSEANLTGAGARFIRLPLNRKGINPLSDLLYLIKITQLLRKEKPDLVINFTVKPIVYGSIAAYTQGVPSFAVTTGLGFVFTKNNLLTFLVRTLYRISLSFPVKIFVLNGDDYEVLLKGSLTDAKKMMILPGEGINTDFYQPLKPVNPQRPFTFLLIARLLWEKGIGEYVQAARMLKSRYADKVVCQLIGYIDEDNPGGIRRSQIAKWTEEGDVQYLGTTDDIRPVIAEVDCVALPSYREGVPRTLMEAASMEKPLIATDCVGCREVVEHGVNGYLCEPGNGDNLFKIMVDMIELTNEERATMGRKGRQKMLDYFDERIVVNMYFDEMKKAGIAQPLS